MLSAQQQAPPQAPAFRSRTTLRAIEVRVVDVRVRPIPGLRQEDFTVLEDGKPQDLRLFAPIELTPAASPIAGDAAVIRAGARPDTLTPSTRRVFLIVLGRGNLQIPSKGLDGMIQLVRTLLPQDVVAVLAWNRATAFTTEHARVVRMLERYRAGHQKVEALMAQRFSGLAAIYGSRDIPPAITREIDAILHGEDVPQTSTVLPADVATDAIEARRRRDLDRLLGVPSLDAIGAAEAEQIGMSLDEYASQAVASMQDLARIHAAVSYLRHMDGDKQLMFVSPSGLHLPSTDDDRSLARLAQDARVAVNIFHSGGISDIWSVASSQNIAEFTGGQYTSLTYGPPFADRVNAATRTGYQLGYAPANPSLDGKYRKVEVKVRRPGARVLFQHGYYARDEFTVLDRRQVVGQSRVEAALRYAEPVADVQFTATALPATASDGRRAMSVQVQVAAGQLTVTGDGAERKASVDVAVFCFDRQYVVGYVWRRVEIGLPDDRYAKFLNSGVGFTISVPIRRSANMVKAVVYDYLADRIGTALPKIGSK